MKNNKKISCLMMCLLMVLSFVGTTWAQEEEEDLPEAAVAPMAVLGEVSDIQKQIIFNSFLDKLTANYDLISQAQFARAQEKAFEALEEAECTEEICIRKIQEILQIENLFILQIIKEDGDTQLSITLIGLDKKKVKSDYCEGCKTAELNRRVAKLLEQLIGKKPLTPAPSAAAPVAAAPVVPPPSPKEDLPPEEAPSGLRQVISFQWEYASFQVSNWFPEANGREFVVTWIMIGLEYGIRMGRHYGAFRILNGTPDVGDALYFNGDRGLTALGFHSVDTIGIYYTPFFGHGWVGGLGYQQLTLGMGTEPLNGEVQLDQTLIVSSPLVDAGYQIGGTVSSFFGLVKVGLFNFEAFLKASIGYQF